MTQAYLETQNNNEPEIGHLDSPVCKYLINAIEMQGNKPKLKQDYL
jgi:hypothetical protein